MPNIKVNAVELLKGFLSLTASHEAPTMVRELL